MLWRSDVHAPSLEPLQRFLSSASLAAAPPAAPPRAMSSHVPTATAAAPRTGRAPRASAIKAAEYIQQKVAVEVSAAGAAAGATQPTIVASKTTTTTTTNVTVHAPAPAPAATQTRAPAVPAAAVASAPSAAAPSSSSSLPSLASLAPLRSVSGSGSGLPPLSALPLAFTGPAVDADGDDPSTLDAEEAADEYEGAAEEEMKQLQHDNELSVEQLRAIYGAPPAAAAVASNKPRHSKHDQAAAMADVPAARKTNPYADRNDNDLTQVSFKHTTRARK